jgi:hypothetical protein
MIKYISIVIRTLIIRIIVVIDGISNPFFELINPMHHSDNPSYIFFSVDYIFTGTCATDKHPKPADPTTRDSSMSLDA